jgi:hypothetical protein
VCEAGLQIFGGHEEDNKRMDVDEDSEDTKRPFSNLIVTWLRRRREMAAARLLRSEREKKSLFPAQPAAFTQLLNGEMDRIREDWDAIIGTLESRVASIVATEEEFKVLQIFPRMAELYEPLQGGLLGGHAEDRKTLLEVDPRLATVEFRTVDIKRALLKELQEPELLRKLKAKLVIAPPSEVRGFLLATGIQSSESAQSFASWWCQYHATRLWMSL